MPGGGGADSLGTARRSSASVEVVAPLAVRDRGVGAAPWAVLVNVFFFFTFTKFHMFRMMLGFMLVVCLRPRPAAAAEEKREPARPFALDDLERHPRRTAVQPPAEFRHKMLFVSESIPGAHDGGGLRAREVLEVAATTFDAQPWLVPRAQWVDGTFRSRANVFDRLGVYIVGDENMIALNVGNDIEEVVAAKEETQIFGEGFVAQTGIGRNVKDFHLLARLMTLGLSNESSVQLALLAMWSYHIAPGGDPHWTIPELVLPAIREHLPDTCAVIVSDDLQHRRTLVEARLTTAQVERLAMREMAAYEAADGVFFVSREDRNEVEAELLRRRQRWEVASIAEMPLLLTLPYVGRHETVANRTRESGPERRRRRGLEPLLLFVGSATRSNELAVTWLVHKVLPILREARPNLELTLAGSRLRTYRVQGVRALGFVDDLNALVAQASVLLLPSFVASGVATKVLLGVHERVPVVTTSAGRRGIWHANDTLPPACQFESTPLVIRDDPSEYAAATLALLEDDRAYHGIQRCLADFAAISREQQQRQAMREMRVHCLARRAGTSGVSSHIEASGQEHERLGGKLNPRADEKHLDVILDVQQRLVPISGDLTDDEMRLSKHAVWHGPAKRLRALDLTVLTSFVAKDAEFVLAWFEDISRQQALRIFVVELVVGCFEEGAHAFMMEAVNRSLGLLGHLARVSICLFADDPGTYGMWDVIIGREATAPVVTNWNVGDRKSPLSLSRRLNVLNSDAHIDAVTSGVLLFNDSRYAWAEGNQAQTLRLFDLCGDRLLQIEDMFVIHWNRSDANSEPTPFVHGSQNVPHNSPMWRKAMHHWVGGFSPKDELGCYDFSFWVRALRQGVRIQHINEPLEMSFERSTSHGHRTQAREPPVWADRWANECDSPGEWAANHAAALHAAMGRYTGLGRCVQEKERAPSVQVVRQLLSPSRNFVLSVQDIDKLCVSPFSTSLSPPQAPSMLVLWRKDRLDREGNRIRLNDKLCLHRVSKRTLQHIDELALNRSAQVWCTWTCNYCTLQLSDTGRVFFSNGTYERGVIQWKPTGAAVSESCWEPRTHIAPSREAHVHAHAHAHAHVRGHFRLRSTGYLVLTSIDHFILTSATMVTVLLVIRAFRGTLKRTMQTCLHPPRARSCALPYSREHADEPGSCAVSDPAWPGRGLRRA